MDTTYTSGWIIPGMDGFKTVLPRVQIKGQSIPTHWGGSPNAVSEEKALELGAKRAMREEPPTPYHAVPAGAYVREEVDGVVYLRLDYSKLEHDIDGHFSAVRAVKQSDIIQGADELLSVQAAIYGPVVRETWERQRQEARNYLEGVIREEEAVLIKTMIASRIASGGKALTVKEQAEKIIGNVTPWEQASFHVVGQQNGFQDRLDAAVAVFEAADDDAVKRTAIADLETLAVEFTLPTND